MCRLGLHEKNERVKRACQRGCADDFAVRRRGVVEGCPGEVCFLDATGDLISYLWRLSGSACAGEVNEACGQRRGRGLVLRVVEACVDHYKISLSGLSMSTTESSNVCYVVEQGCKQSSTNGVTNLRDCPDEKIKRGSPSAQQSTRSEPLSFRPAAGEDSTTAVHMFLGTFCHTASCPTSEQGDHVSTVTTGPSKQSGVGRSDQPTTVPLFTPI